MSCCNPGRRDTAEAASLFYYLNRTGYNGLCRFNRKDGFNVPFGRYKKMDYRTDFSEYQPVFSRFEFTHTDFERLPLASRRLHLRRSAVRRRVHASTRAAVSAGTDQKRAAEWLAKHSRAGRAVEPGTDPDLKLYQETGLHLASRPPLG